jgi:protein-tyrosine phosphatase
VENMKKILFVCSKNGFRSPSAALLLKSLLKKHEIKGISVDSAGVSKNSKLTENDIKLLKDLSSTFKYDYVNRRRKKINEKLVKKSDKIIVFQTSHKEFIESTYPNSKNKVFLFNELIGLKDESKFSDMQHKPVKDHVKFVSIVKKLMEINLDKIIE